METIYLASTNIFGENIILGWSEKEKIVRKFIEESFNNFYMIEIIKIKVEDINELFQCPFDLDIKSIENDHILKYAKHCLTSLEWDIIDNEFEKFIYVLNNNLGILPIIQDALSEKGKSAMKIVKGEIENLDTKDIYKAFLNNHKFCRGANTIESIAERILIRKSFLESKEMDREYRQIIGIKEYI